MGLKLTYNGYTFDTDTTVVPISREYQRDARGRRDKLVQHFRATTTIQAATEALIDAEVNSALTALASDGHDLTLYQTDGATATPHVITSANTLSGTRVLRVAWPEATGPEYANRRTMTVEFEAESQVSGKADDLVSFTETVRITGTGGPRYAIIETVEGSPQRYQVAQKTMVRATQSGSATGRTGYPSPPDPIWSNYELQDRRSIIDAPTYQADGGTYYTRSWSYEFESPAALSGDPDIWGS